MATAITAKPDKKVSNLGAPTKSGHTMTANWDVPASMVKSDSKKRATSLRLKWKIDMLTDGVLEKKKTGISTSTKSASINLNNFKVGETTYKRSSFYPLANRYLNSVTIQVWGHNDKGDGSVATATRAFTYPAQPTVDAIAFDPSTGICTTAVHVGSGTEYQERYDTRYRMTVVSRIGTLSTIYDTSTTASDASLQYDASDFRNLSGNQYICVQVDAWSRGFWGDSTWGTQKYYIARPYAATIENVTVTSMSTSGQCVVKINTNATTEHPVDVVKLEYLKNVTYASASEIPVDEEWDETGVEDNGNCAALSVPVSVLMPTKGKYTYVRVKSYRADENVLVNYSAPYNVEQLYIKAPTAEDDTVSIISVTPYGEYADVLLGWNPTGQDDSTGTELSWADDEEMWRSTEKPHNFDFEWSDGRYPKTGTIQYRDSALVRIKGLTEATKYFIKARRYMETADGTQYGRYSNVVDIITYEPPSAVVAICDKYVPEGEPLSIYWTFSGTSLQKRWQIKDSSGRIMLDGTGSLGSTQIDAKILADHAVNNTVTFHVEISTGSEFVSETASHNVTIVPKPTLSITAPTTLTAQPFSFSATSNRLCDLVVIVTSQGASGQKPEGYVIQTAGDTVYSDAISPVWSNNSATVTLPSGLDFWDNAQYTLSVVAIDRETRLQSDEKTAFFAIDWARKAVDPDSAITLIPQDYITAGGEHIQGVQISLTPPTGSNATDVYDIYRMNGYTAQLIGRGFPLTHEVVDEYAPFGDDDDLFYRIAIRTADGSVEFADKPYTLESDTIRFDWQGGTLELPYGISIGDSYKKDVEFRQHMDGSVDGYWNQNIERKGSYNSSVIKLIQPDEINLARQLARYAGAVFVRTANGSAFTADVQVTDLSVKNKAVTAMAFDATEVGITEEFMLPVPFDIEDE